MVKVRKSKLPFSFLNEFTSLFRRDVNNLEREISELLESEIMNSGEAFEGSELLTRNSDESQRR